MRKVLMSLLLGGILIGAAYGTAASLTVGGVDDIGAGEQAIANPGSYTDVTYTLLAADNSIASKVGINSNGTGELSDVVNIAITETDCNGAIQFTIATTGASAAKDVNLDSNSGNGAVAPYTQASGDGLTSTGLPVSLIDCIKISVVEAN